MSETFRREDNNLIMTGGDPRSRVDNRIVNISSSKPASVFGSLSGVHTGIIIVINVDGKPR